MAGTVRAKLAAQGVVLHEPASPVANYVGFVRTGNLLFVSGQVCIDAEGKLIAKGKLGAGVTVEQGNAAARGCAINLLAHDQDRARRPLTRSSAWCGLAVSSIPRRTFSMDRRCSTARPT